MHYRFIWKIIFWFTWHIYVYRYTIDIYWFDCHTVLALFHVLGLDVWIILVVVAVIDSICYTWMAVDKIDRVQWFPALLVDLYHRHCCVYSTTNINWTFCMICLFSRWPPRKRAQLSSGYFWTLNLMFCTPKWKQVVVIVACFLILCPSQSWFNWSNVNEFCQHYF